MRIIENHQMQLGEINVSKINLDMNSRDDIPQILQGLQYLYSDKDVRDKLFTALTKLIPHGVDSNNGRPGMHLWQIFVLGTIRLNLNIDRAVESNRNSLMVQTPSFRSDRSTPSFARSLRAVGVGIHTPSQLRVHLEEMAN